MVISGGEALTPGSRAGSTRCRTPSCATPTAPPRRRSYTTLWTCRRDETRSRVPIGRPIANTRALRPGRAWRAGADRRARRAVHRRRRRGARLPESPRLDAERFVADPFARAAGGADVPDRRHRRAACRTATSSSWAASTTRSRCAASASSWARSRRRWRGIRRCARRWSCCARTRPGTSGWSPTWCRATAPRGGRPARLRQAEPARLHGARRVRAAAGAAADAQRQGGPARAARAGIRRQLGRHACFPVPRWKRRWPKPWPRC